MQRGLKKIVDLKTRKSVARLYDTDVATLHLDTMELEVATGGWITKSTAKAINTFLTEHELKARVFRRKGSMYLQLEGSEPQLIEDVLKVSL